MDTAQIGRLLGGANYVVAAQGSRDEEQEFSGDDMRELLATHHEALRLYRGEWVAIVGHDIIAHAPSFLEVMKRVESLGVENPFLVPVSPDQPFIA